MSDKDYYELLGVSRDADASEIKKAFRRLAMEHHPDRQSGDAADDEKFKEINEAYEVLKDPEKRGRYDRFGAAGVGGAAGHPGGGFGADFGGGDFQDLFGDVFSDIFGGGRTRGGRRGGAERGADLRYDMEITFEEAAFGTESKVTIPRHMTCESCRGSGAKKGTSPETCPGCQGTGQSTFQQGFFTIQRPCSQCNGQGKVIKSPCPDCSGVGKKLKRSELTVKIPAGVYTGSRLRLTGEGEAGSRGGPPGDLYVMLSVAPHPIFKRHDDDVICEVPISFVDAALGAEVKVPTIEGVVTLKVPAGTQTDKIFRIRGKGIASLQTGRRGDSHIVVKVETPAKLTKRQKELLKEFKDDESPASMPISKKFASLVKEVLK